MGTTRMQWRASGSRTPHDHTSRTASRRSRCWTCPASSHRIPGPRAASRTCQAHTGDSCPVQSRWRRFPKGTRSTRWRRQQLRILLGMGRSPWRCCTRCQADKSCFGRMAPSRPRSCTLSPSSTAPACSSRQGSKQDPAATRAHCSVPTMPSSP